MRPYGLLILIILPAFATSCSPDYVERLVEQQLSGIEGNGAEVVAAWVVLPHACIGCIDFTLVAFSDDRIIWRDVRPDSPTLEQLRTMRASGLVESVFGSEEERQSLAQLDMPDLPEEWVTMWSHQRREALCFADDREWTCHSLTNPFGFLVGRTLLEACDSDDPRASGIPTSYCEEWHAYHAELPEVLAAPFRRAYDLMHSPNSSPFFPARISVHGRLAAPRHVEGSSTLYDPCISRGTVAWPGEITMPHQGTQSAAESSWTLELTAIEAARLSSEIQNSPGPVGSCVFVHGQQWTVEATFQLPQLQGAWPWHL